MTTAADPARAGEELRQSLRDRFPGLRTDEVLLDNAGGSQLPDTVIEAVREYLTHRYVQHGADYARSREATRIADQAHAFVRVLMNGDGIGEVALGPSTSVLCHTLADAYARAPVEGRDEIIVAESGHEANVGPWVRLADRGYRVRWWKVDPERGRSDIEALVPLLSERTRIVAFPHVSNILGGIEEAARAVALAHDAGARAVVDGVAYAPHRAMDVRALGADWYVYSVYKVLGTHMAALFGTHEAFGEVEGPNHFFIARDDVPYKFELGGVSHEGCAGLLGLRPYLALAAGEPEWREDRARAIVERAFGAMHALENPLQRRLIGFLEGRPHVRLIGPGADDEARVCTVSFVHERLSSREIALRANEEGICVRFGHFYAHRLCAALGLEPADGVVRASMMHYNTPGEIERLVEFLDRTL